MSTHESVSPPDTATTQMDAPLDTTGNPDTSNPAAAPPAPSSNVTDTPDDPSQQLEEEEARSDLEDNAYENEDEEEGDSEDNDVRFVHAVRKSKTKAHRITRKGCKAGNQGRWDPDMESLLTEFLDAYGMIDKPGRGKNKGLEEFWAMVRNAFWGRFSWREARAVKGEAWKTMPQEIVMTKTNEVSSLPKHAPTAHTHDRRLKPGTDTNTVRCRRRQRIHGERC